MQIITVNFHLNQKYNVEKSAIQQIIENVFSASKRLKLENYDVKIGESPNSIQIYIKISTNKIGSIKLAVDKVISQLEYHIYNLVNNKPQNITIEISEFN